MFSRVVTTITTDVDLEKFEPAHSVEIETEDGLPADFVASAVYGACRATMHSLDLKYPHLRLSRVDDADDADKPDDVAARGYSEPVDDADTDEETP